MHWLRNVWQFKFILISCVKSFFNSIICCFLSPQSKHFLCFLKRKIVLFVNYGFFHGCFLGLKDHAIIFVGLREVKEGIFEVIFWAVFERGFEVFTDNEISKEFKMFLKYWRSLKFLHVRVNIIKIPLFYIKYQSKTLFSRSKYANLNKIPPENLTLYFSRPSSSPYIYHFY